MPRTAEIEAGAGDGCAAGGAGVGGGGRAAERMVCRALTSRRTTKVYSLPCVLAKTHGKDLFVVRFLAVRPANKDFNNFTKSIKISNKFEKIRKLTQIKL
jgi:predicted RNase H-like nuclease